MKNNCGRRQALPVSIAKSGEGFIIINIGGGDGCQHGSLRVTTQVLPQKPGENRVPVRDELTLLLLLFVRRIGVGLKIKDPENS